MNIKIIILLIAISIVSFLSYNYIYQGHRNIRLEEARYSLTSDSLFRHFKNNQIDANELYNNQILALSGSIKSISNDYFILSPGIVCSIDSTFTLPNLDSIETINIKGRCIGFDDLFLEVKMDKIILD